MIAFPQYFSARNAILAALTCQEISHQTGVIEIDASALLFIDPFGIAMLGACFDGVLKRGDKLRVYGLSSNLSGYLQRMDLFKDVELVNCAVNHVNRKDQSNALVELTQVTKHAEVGATSLRLATAIVGQFHHQDPNEVGDEMTGYTTHQRLIEPIQYVFSELLENALTHARRGNKEACVWVASQYYNSGIIRLGIVDNGCGFLESLRGHAELEKKKHLQAILLALRPRISCNRDLVLGNDSVNQGVGLTTSFRIVEQAGGNLTLLSGDAMHNTSGYGVESDGAYWQGVGLALELKRHRLADVRLRELLPMLSDLPPVTLRFE